MATFEESFLYPLVLLLIGAGVSGVMVAWLTNRWQNRRKELEIKVDIASKMAEAVAYYLANALILTYREKFTAADEVAYYESMRKWYIDVNIISSKLASYFPQTDIRDRWVNYYPVLVAFNEAIRWYFYKSPSEEQKNSLKQQRENIEKIRNYFENNMHPDWNRLTTEMTYYDPLWTKVGNLVYARSNEIIRDVLKQRIKVF
jgi:hypothetical protein